MRFHVNNLMGFTKPGWLCRWWFVALVAVITVAGVLIEWGMQ